MFMLLPLSKLSLYTKRKEANEEDYIIYNYIVKVPFVFNPSGVL